MPAIAKSRDCSAQPPQNKAALSVYFSGSGEVMAKLAQYNRSTPFHKMMLKLPALLHTIIRSLGLTKVVISKKSTQNRRVIWNRGPEWLGVPAMLL